MNLLRIQGSVTVDELRKAFSVSEETVRRDLNAMEEEGLLNRVYGGAYLGNLVGQTLPSNMRKETLRAEKENVAEICAGLIENGDTIMLDSSTTALFTVKSIVSKHNLTIITNSVEILLDLPQNHDWNIISTGGSYRSESMAFYGSTAENLVSRYHVDLALLSCKGLDMEKGMTDTREHFAELKRAFLRSARKVILAVDHTKFDKVSFVRIGSLSDVDAVVTDVAPSDAWKRHFEEQKIELYY
jgi:DeoR/GlpR family transcriptional regulator of sugar metabolism